MLHDYGVLNFWTFLAGALFIVIIPGTNSLYVLRTGISRGIGAAYRGVAGVMLGDTLLIFLAWAGIVTLIQTSPHIFIIVRYLGALFLLWLGIKILWTTMRKTLQGSADKVIKIETYCLKAFLLSITNPKSILFHVSFFIQFVDPAVTNTSFAFSFLGAVLQIISLSWLSILLLTGAALARWFRGHKRVVKLANSLTGLLFISFAARLAATQS
ncbi:leucine efflux protein LeuE [Dickeya dadantii]|uniref:leucine efflux protein LeuE n=1 Tax=Dickeya dadantii TaxID=204038 RepID=UPI0035A8DDA7